MKLYKVKTRKEVEDLEKAARKLLDIPKLPDGANGPKAQAILDQINEDRANLGEQQALKKWMHVATVNYAMSLDDDDPDVKSVSKKNVDNWKDPTNQQEYIFPTDDELENSINDPDKRKKIKTSDLAKLAKLAKLDKIK